jgi:hypothetical protein
VTVVVALDNDVVIKLAYFGLLDSSTMRATQRTFSVLGTARFVASYWIRRDGKAIDPAAAKAHLDEFFKTVAVVEPSALETSLATNIEDVAGRRGLELDTGESLLAAITVVRQMELFLTGDKRAICALEILHDDMVDIAPLKGRVACLEQLFGSLVDECGAEAIRQSVCSCPAADRSVAICFGCARNGQPFDAGGLVSYVADLRVKAPKLLVVGSSAFD